MYYKIELFSGCYCNEIDGIQTYGPEIYYSGIIYMANKLNDTEEIYDNGGCNIWKQLKNFM